MQINAGRAAKTTVEIRGYAEKSGIQVVAIQEPYTIKGKMASFGRVAKIVSGEGNGETAWAGIVIFDPSLVVMKLEQFSDTHIVCVQVDNGKTATYIVSAYFQYSKPIEPYIERIGNIVRLLNGKRIVVCADANAYSPLWFSDKTTTEGELVEFLLMERNLYVANLEDNPKTYSQPGGEGNIDITVVSENVINLVDNWTVHEGWITSDHYAITFGVLDELHHGMSYERKEMAKFVTSKAKWDLFDRAYIRKAPKMGECRNVDEVMMLVRGIRRAMVEACRESMPRKGRVKISAKWWNNELTDSKKGVHKLRKEFQKLKKQKGSEEELGRIKACYHKMRREHEVLVHRTRMESWRKFMTEMNKEPWGYAYKLSCNKLKGAQVLNSMRCSNGHTVDWRDTAQELLNGLFCFDDSSVDTSEQESVRNQAEMTYVGESDENPILEKDVEEVIKKLKVGKAPGWDRIDATIIKRAWELSRETFVALFNGCWRHGIFPKEWKKAIVVTLLKADDKPKVEPSSYRPICLLPVMGKIMESLILRRLKQKTDTELSDRQFGSRHGKSTEDALHEFLELQEGLEEKYAMGVFLDISNAFNNLWWPAIIKEIKSIESSNQLVRIIKSYLSDRQVVFKTESGCIIREVNKGCPQGSVLGPALWNVVFNDLLKKFGVRNIRIVAFADDVVVIVIGNSRREIEARGQEAIDLANNWCKFYKMELSAKKTEMMLLKGKMSATRNPLIGLDEKRIGRVEKFKYLGVTLEAGERGLRAGEHVENICDKSRAMFSALKRVAKREWGLGYKALRIIYKGLFLAMITYVASVWHDRINVRDWRRLGSAQRFALIGVTGAYRTISLKAVQVIAGELPIRLEIYRRVANYRIRKGQTVSIGNRIYTPHNGNKRLMKELQRRKYKELREIWQEEWSESLKGRTTFGFFPNIELRLRMTWIEPSFYVTQILSGHGDFNARLTKMNLRDDATCACGMAEDDVGHLIRNCQLIDDERNVFISVCEASGRGWPIQDEELMTKDIYPDFKIFLTTALKKKEELEQG